ncbi:PAS domain S-box protein [Poseidonibacter lekithochrous]|uniref:sensor histidine kinase n=1 Tax=Poseidonibacter TaxID=2321187 RepID=UPI001C084DAD|nr:MULTISPECIES: ATP-binding protein [Poseidonibacter]MBU3014549.1 PAS domain S-box protein [Poseidonibacter lekithochrous]MDO6827847.1 ATP-binding protein [Poseidonibacter sp. 1_MG-2023]
MKKLTIIYFLIYTFFLSTFLFANSSILIINSYHKGYEFSDNIILGLEKQLHKHEDIDFTLLYMDAKRITSDEYFKNLKNLYKVQLQSRNYDLVIAIDRFAYDFVLENYNDFFLNEAILAVGIENFSPIKAKKYGIENKVSALIEKRDLSANVKLIETIIPTIKKLYVIDDKSINAKHTEPLIKELFNEFDNRYELIYLREDTLANLEKRFAKYEENSAILFIRFYKNSDGKLNKNQAIKEFINNSKVPVFITDSIFNKKGAVGGKIVDLEKFGNKAGLIALDILENKSFSIEKFNDFDYVFDAKKLDQFTLAVNQVPYDYKIVNRRLTFYDKNRGLIDFVFTISPILVLLIIGLFHNIYLRKKTEKMLIQRIEFDSVLLNAIESPIFWQNKDGKIIDSNKKFCNFISLQSKEIYGKKLNDFKENENASKLLYILDKYKENEKENTIFKFQISKNVKKIYFIKQTSYCDSKTKETGTVTIFTDITKEKEYEVEREKNQEFVIQQSKLAEIGEIFSSIAHQWKSPLVEITTIAQESFYSSNTTTNEDESYVKDIMTQVDYMNKTINDFQNFIVPSNEKKVFDAKESLDSILQIVNHNIKYNYIDVTIKVFENTNTNIYGYRNEFMQSTLNIINNAKDELLKNDLKNRKIDIEFYNKENKLFITIQDNAGGIETSKLKKIFKPYYSTKKDGHGIGLYMAKMIIEDKMNGKIEVENIKDGACFKMIFGNVK